MTTTYYVEAPEPGLRSSFGAMENGTEALKPDPSTVPDFRVDNSPFAFTPAKLRRLLKSKVLSVCAVNCGTIGVAGDFTGFLLLCLPIGEAMLESPVPCTGITPPSLSVPLKHACEACRRSALISEALRKLRRLRLSHARKAGRFQELEENSNTTRNLLPILADGQAIDALPDSMSCANVISEEYANLRDFHIDDRPIKRQVFVNAIGHEFESIGEARVLLSLPGGRETSSAHVEKFAVVRKCAAMMVLGQPFLIKHEIFTRFRHCLKKVAVTARRVWRLMYMENNRQKFVCCIDGENTTTSIDTGSEKSFFSLDYAQKRGWKVNPMQEDEGFVELADGTIVKVIGYVDKAIAIGDQEQWERFYVLKGLMSDALLGDEMIDRIDFYNLTGTEKASRHWVVSGVINEFHAISWMDKIEDHASKFLNYPDYEVPNQYLSKILKDLQQPNNTPSPSPVSRPRKWWHTQSRQQERLDQQHRLLQSGIWTKLERLDNTESEARRKARDAIDQATGDDQRKLQEADEARRQKHVEERTRLLELREKLLDWNRKRNERA